MKTFAAIQSITLVVISLFQGLPAARDVTPPFFSITDPAALVASTERSFYCLQGIAEPDAALVLNGHNVVLHPSSLEFESCVDLFPGLNTIKMEARDQAGNTSPVEIIITSSPPLTPTPTPAPTPIPDDPGASNARLFLLLGLALLLIGLGLLIGYTRRRKRLPPPGHST